MKARHKRFLLIGIAMLLLGGAVALVLNAFRDNLVFFFTPSEVASGKVPQGRTFRVGGMVEAGSIQRSADGMTVSFKITDGARDMVVHYTGALPDLFRDARGAVVDGRLDAAGNFTASQVLAKHDENYMPPEAKDAIERAHQAARTLKQ